MMGWLPRIKWNSIHTKLLATYLLLTTLGTSLMAGYTFFSFHTYFTKARQTEIQNWGAALSESMADALDEDDFNRVELLVQRFGAADSITIRVLSSKGTLIATSNPLLDQKVVSWLEVPGVKEALANRAVQGVAKGILSNDDRLFFAQPIVRNGQLIGVLRMSITLQQFQRQFATIVSTLLGTVAVTLLVCAMLSDWLARSLARPIQTMKDFAIKMGGGHFGDKLQIRQSNELDQLAQELNRMSERLASLDQERRAFLVNVSHELRTPISNVLVTVEALRGGAARDPRLSDRFFQNVEDEAKRLSRLIDDLLDLGRLEAGVTSLEMQTLQLSSLISRAVRAVETRMQSRQIVAQVKIVDVQINGDLERLLQAFLNILDNAIKHSVPNAQILIHGYVEDKQVVVKICDQGEGIKESDIPRIFEQFYTADRSRKGTGVGLGLAIAKRIVEAHDGSITASSKWGEGAEFIIRLPL